MLQIDTVFTVKTAFETKDVEVLTVLHLGILYRLPEVSSSNSEYKIWDESSKIDKDVLRTFFSLKADNPNCTEPVIFDPKLTMVCSYF